MFSLTILTDKNDKPYCLYVNAENFEYELRDDVKEWCNLYLRPGWSFSSTAQWDDRYIHAKPIIEFTTLADMIAFKLRWL